MHIWDRGHKVVLVTHSFISDGEKYVIDEVPSKSEWTVSGTFIRTLLGGDIKLTNAAANVIWDEATLALVIGDAVERAQCVVADKVWPAIVGTPSALIDV